MVTYKEFRVGDLFEIVKKTALIKDFEKSLVKTDELSIPATSASSVNNMLTYWVSPDEHDCLHNMITIAANGSFGVACYQEGPFAISQDSYAIYCEKDTTKEAYMYMTACMNKRLIEYSYDRKAGWNRFKEDVISLPTTTTGQPDFDFMENYIKEIEQKHIKKLKSDLDSRTENLLTMIGREELIGDPDGLAAVVAAGFDSTGVNYAEFRVGDLFDMVSKTSKVKGFSKVDKIDVTHTLPATSSTTINNMIGYYVDPLEHNALRNCLTITANGIKTGFVTYQPSDFGISQDSYALFIKPSNYGAYPPSIYYYMMSVLSKALADYDYNKKAGWTRVSEETIKLPITPTGTPDFDFMAQYIAYIELKYTLTDAMVERERIDLMVELTQRKTP